MLRLSLLDKSSLQYFSGGSLMQGDGDLLLCAPCSLHLLEACSRPSLPFRKAHLDLYHCSPAVCLLELASVELSQSRSRMLLNTFPRLIVGCTPAWLR
jgi:hypothetical protein